MSTTNAYAQKTHRTNEGGLAQYAGAADQVEGSKAGSQAAPGAGRKKRVASRREGGVFKCGDVRKDGFRFWNYRKHRRREGEFEEVWLSPGAYERSRLARNRANSRWCKIHRKKKV